MSHGGCLIESMARYIGQTVTIFTKSGGLSGNGFTGVLAGICDGCVKLITDIGACRCILLPWATSKNTCKGTSKCQHNTTRRLLA